MSEKQAITLPTPGQAVSYDLAGGAHGPRNPREEGTSPVTAPQRVQAVLSSWTERRRRGEKENGADRP